MNTRRLLELGGIIAGTILIAFGAAAIYMGVDGRSTVRDSIRQEQIVFGSAADDDAVAKHAKQWSGQQVLTGEQARGFAEVMREHTLARTDGLTYAQMGRFVAAANPDDPRGTSDEAGALKDETGAPVANEARTTWVTETALTTALNMSFMAEQLSTFGIVVGVALLLAGIGFVILAWNVLGGGFKRAERVVAPSPARAATGH